MVQDPQQHLLERLKGQLDDESQARLRRHHEMLLTWNRLAHLVSAGDASPAGLVRHDLEALQALPFLPAAGRVVDVGSGGGFPGLIWACVRPDLEFVLVEAIARKAAFLREVVRALNLRLVTVMGYRLQGAAELVDVGGQLWTSRAAGCTDLLLQAGGLATDALRLVLYAGGGNGAAVIRQAGPVWQCMEDAALQSGAAGRLIVLQRTS